jgi:hypothetical protein
MSYPRYLRIPCSASIEESSVCATVTPESCTDFFGIVPNLPEPRRTESSRR